MIRLAFSTNAFKKATLAEAIDAIADAGYTGVEIMADVPHAHPLHTDAAARTAIRKQLFDRSLKVSNINAFTHFADGDTYHPTWIENDSALRDVRIRHTIGAVEMAAEISAGTVSVQPGGPLIGTNLDPCIAAERFATGLERVLPHARRADVMIAIEPEPGLMIQTAAEYQAFKSTFFAEEPLIRMNCDVGHLFCVGDDPATVIADMSNEVSHVHLEDIGENHVHQHLTPGKGVLRFDSIFEALESISYRGWITVELYPYEATAAEVAKAAIDHLSAYFR